MRRPFLIMLGLVMAVIALAGCSEAKELDYPAEAEVYEQTPATPEAAAEAVLATPPTEEEYSEESIDKEEPVPLKGAAEDEVLSVSVVVEPDSKGNYSTKIVFRNKAENSVDLLYDCGMLINRNQSVPDEGVCIAVESELLKKNQQTTAAYTLPGEFFDAANGMITVRYRQGQTRKQLDIQLQPLPTD